MNNIYFDNAATTYPLYNIKPLYNNYFYNSNAQYSKGVSVYQLNHNIRNQIKKILNVESGKVIMGGTTSQLIFYLINKYRSYNMCNFHIFHHPYYLHILRSYFSPMYIYYIRIPLLAASCLKPSIVLSQ